MRRNFVQLCLLIFTSIVVVDSNASGLGFTLGVGFEDWDDTLIDETRNLKNIGFVIDTNVAQDRVFNYRFTMVREENNGYSVDMKGIVMTHDFGFGVFRNERVRFWLGPELRAVIYDDVSANQDSTIFNSSGDSLGYGLGLVVAANFHVSKLASIGISARYFGGFSGYTRDDYWESSDSDVDSRGIYLNVSVLFRMDDEY